MLDHNEKKKNVDADFVGAFLHQTSFLDQEFTYLSQANVRHITELVILC